MVRRGDGYTRRFLITESGLDSNHDAVRNIKYTKFSKETQITKYTKYKMWKPDIYIYIYIYI